MDGGSFEEAGAELDEQTDRSLERLLLADFLRDAQVLSLGFGPRDLLDARWHPRQVARLLLRSRTPYSADKLSRVVRSYPRSLALAIRVLWKRRGKGASRWFDFPLQSIKLFATLFGHKRRTISSFVAGVLSGHGGRSLETTTANGFVTSSHAETPLIRTVILLRTLGRRAEATRLLTRRLHSGLPAERTRKWLARLLSNIGDDAAAGRLRRGAPPSGDAGDPVAGLRMAVKSSKGKKFGIIMQTMVDSPIARSSLQSLVRSDFEGEIVVVEEGNRPERAFEAFCRNLPVKYLKSDTWKGCSANMNLALEHFAPDTEIAVYTHNDVLWPEKWFGHLRDAWATLGPGGNVGMLNMGYMHFESAKEPGLRELFLDGHYKDLLWITKAMQEIPETRDRVIDVSLRDRSRPFGLSIDPLLHRMKDLKVMAGRFGVGSSFPVSIWKQLGGFDEAMPYGFDLELLDYCNRNRKWNIWINNPSPLHMFNGDTNLLNREEYRRSRELMHVNNARFLERYGHDIEHVLFTHFGDLLVVHEDEITDAINRGDFSSIDYLFDEYAERLREKTLANCETIWCPLRGNCRYV